MLQELIFQRLFEELFGELYYAASILDDLYRLNARKLVEKPAATGVHEHSIALQLHELPNNDLLVGGQLAGEILLAESLPDIGCAAKDNIDVTVARLPWICEQR